MCWGELQEECYITSTVITISRGVNTEKKINWCWNTKISKHRFYIVYTKYEHFNNIRLRELRKPSKMLKFIWGKGQRENPERLKLQKELFGFSKVRFNLNNNKWYVIR